MRSAKRSGAHRGVSLQEAVLSHIKTNMRGTWFARALFSREAHIFSHNATR